MSGFTVCCGIPEQESSRDSGNVADDAPTSSMNARPTELLLYEVELRFDNGILKDYVYDRIKYADLIQNGDVPEVSGIEILFCPVEYDFSHVLSRHGDTIKSASIQYVCHPNCPDGCPNVPWAMLRLTSSLKRLSRLSFLSIHGRACSPFPTDLLEGLADFTSLQSLSLSGTFTFGTLSVQCSSIEYLAIKEEGFTEFRCAVDLSKLNRLKTVSVAAKRKLILPVESSSLFAVSVSNITSLEGAKLPNLSVLSITDCAPSVVLQLLEDTDPAILRQLVIDNKDTFEVQKSLDARKLDILHLSNIEFEDIETCEETPVKSLSLINTTIMSTFTGLTLHAISAYVACNNIDQANKFYLNPNILQRLGLGSKDEIVRELNEIQTIAMQLSRSMQHVWSSTSERGPITFPEMPRLHYLVLSTVAEWDSTGKVPRLVELAMPGFFWEECGGNYLDDLKVSSHVTSTNDDFDAFEYWS